MFDFEKLLNLLPEPVILGFGKSVIEKLSPETREKLAILAAKKITEYVEKNS